MVETFLFYLDFCTQAIGSIQDLKEPCKYFLFRYSEEKNTSSSNSSWTREQEKNSLNFSHGFTVYLPQPSELLW